MKQGDIKLEKEKGQTKLVGPETEVQDIAASDLNLWEAHPQRQWAWKRSGDHYGLISKALVC